jgi:SAM-dependent methyltransferase
MAELSERNPTGRFTGLAEGYARHRPDYPAAALDFIMAHCGLGRGALLVDVGSGTGISSRLFAVRGVRVIGIEPNAEMRTRAEAEALPAGVPAPEYRDGRAEATGLADQSGDAVLCAQAFHWFEPAATLAEFQRILKPGGWVVLVWNERDEADPFTAEYGKVIRSVPEASGVEGPRGRAGEPLLTSPLFRNALRRDFAHEQPLDEEGVLGRAFSASYAPRAPAQAEAFAAGLRAVFSRHQQAGKVVLRYVTSVTVGQR